ncbi:MAG: SPFH domain-containing protein [Streptosporangiaceae bacterium]|jgi:regulator of protease activity HflC (stomatin/prohibitin superfamily)
MDHNDATSSSGDTVIERSARTIGGWPVVWACLIALAVGIVLVSVERGPGAVAPGAILIAASLIIAGGLTVVPPGEARVALLFGRYTGTIRDPGLHWVNPLMQRRRISVRVRNHQTEVAKVNDANGNPIEIAAVLVWQVTDTAKAVFAVDDYPKFVAVQTETAVRHTAGSYPYDAAPGELSLLQNADQINTGLAAEIANRIATAGARVVEARLMWLSYAPEIAAVMLRRQQASAVIAARQQILDGAIGMVRGALERLSADGGIELDEERKAAMISNLLVVLCSEQQTQPVVNTGTLYQ